MRGGRGLSGSCAGRPPESKGRRLTRPLGPPRGAPRLPPAFPTLPPARGAAGRGPSLRARVVGPRPAPAAAVTAAHSRVVPVPERAAGGPGLRGRGAKHRGAASPPELPRLPRLPARPPYLRRVDEGRRLHDAVKSHCRLPPDSGRVHWPRALAMPGLPLARPARPGPSPPARAASESKGRTEGWAETRPSFAPEAFGEAYEDPVGRPDAPVEAAAAPTPDPRPSPKVDPSGLRTVGDAPGGPEGWR